ncbi:MAG: hypothetical protein EBQ96_03695 [Proteobacteria bacterium]|nr:hypothetical protein [Pseudomonadota bacterium]
MRTQSQTTKGNILFMLLVAIVLIAALTYAITRGDQAGGNLTREKTSLAADQVASLGVDLRRAVDAMTRAGRSETTISFAHAAISGYGTPDTTPDAEVFNISGGGVAYIDVPDGVNDGSQWEFYGLTAAPGMGEEANADLMLVLPNVNETFCRAFNKKAGYPDNAAIPTDGAACLHNTSSRFAGAFATGGGVNTMDTATFRTPAPFACVACSGPAYHVYYVLMDR